MGPDQRVSGAEMKKRSWPVHFKFEVVSLLGQSELSSEGVVSAMEEEGERGEGEGRGSIARRKASAALSWRT